MSNLGRYFRLIILLVLFRLPPSSAAQVVGNCDPSLGEAYLDANNVRARILNNGSLFYRGEPHVYTVPSYSGLNSIFAGSIWIARYADGTPVQA